MRSESELVRKKRAACNIESYRCRHILRLRASFALALLISAWPLSAASQNVPPLPLIPPCELGARHYRDIALARDGGIPEARRANRLVQKDGTLSESDRQRDRSMIHEIYSHPDMTPGQVFFAYIDACRHLIDKGVIPPSPHTLLQQ
jgi:hypothetical protein